MNINKSLFRIVNTVILVVIVAFASLDVLEHYSGDRMMYLLISILIVLSTLLIILISYVQHRLKKPER